MLTVQLFAKWLLHFVIAEFVIDTRFGKTYNATIVRNFSTKKGYFVAQTADIQMDQ